MNIINLEEMVRLENIPVESLQKHLDAYQNWYEPKKVVIYVNKQDERYIARLYIDKNSFNKRIEQDR